MQIYVPMIDYRFSSDTNKEYTDMTCICDRVIKNLTFVQYVIPDPTTKTRTKMATTGRMVSEWPAAINVVGT